jgi:hypothetical protein
LKQTLEADYDPGPLLLRGPNVRFTLANQLLSRTDEGKPLSRFRVGVATQNNEFALTFRARRGARFVIEVMRGVTGNNVLRLREGETSDSVREQVPVKAREFCESILAKVAGGLAWEIHRQRCLLMVRVGARDTSRSLAVNPVTIGFGPVSAAEKWLRGLIHVPALRGNPQRTYPIVETHSRTLLLAIQTLVARGELSTELVKLHWFTRDPKSGTTAIQSADLDSSGAFGDWPQDFGQVELDVEGAYLDAAEARLRREKDG